MSDSEKFCNARVAGAQGGFCRNEAVAGRDYCEVHDDPQPRLRWWQVRRLRRRLGKALREWDGRLHVID